MGKPRRGDQIKAREGQIKYRLSHKPQKAKQVAAWYALNRERMRHKRAEYRRLKKDRIKQQIARWRSKNRNIWRQFSRNYRARIKGAIGSHTAEQWDKIKKTYQYYCHWGIHVSCPRILTDETATRDHIIPLSKGGTNYIDNIVPSCRSCNSSKGAKLL